MLSEEKKHEKGGNKKDTKLEGKKLPSPPEIGCLAEGTISTAWHVTQNTIK
jgi:hypothetical protein